MATANEIKQAQNEQIVKNIDVPKGTIIESKIYPSEFSGKRSNIAKAITTVKKPISASSARQQVDYYLNQLSSYIDWATSSDPDPMKTENSFFPSFTRTITFQAAKPEEKDTKGGKKHNKKNVKSKKNHKSKKGSQRDKNKTRKQK